MKLDQILREEFFMSSNARCKFDETIHTNRFFCVASPGRLTTTTFTAAVATKEEPAITGKADTGREAVAATVEIAGKITCTI